MIKKILFCCFLILAFGCGSGYKHWQVGKFNMQPNALSGLEEIKLLYSTRAPENADDRDYYLHVIVVSQKTGDTVNILTTFNNGFIASDADAVFNFLPDVTGGKGFDEVLRDPKYDKIADNKYPTVKGAIVVYGKN